MHVILSLRPVEAGSQGEDDFFMRFACALRENDCHHRNE
jgi:hypothetical protein